MNTKEPLVRAVAILPTHIRMARAGLDWSVRKLAKCAGVTPNTISRIENNGKAHPSTLEVIRRCFEEQGIEFFEGGVVSMIYRKPEGERNDN